MTHEMEPLISAVRRTIKAMDDRAADYVSWLPDTETKAWHYMAGTLTAFLPQELQEDLVGAVQMLVAKAESRVSDATPDAWHMQARLDNVRDPKPFEAVGKLSYDSELDALLDETGKLL